MKKVVTFYSLNCLRVEQHFVSAAVMSFVLVLQVYWSLCGTGISCLAGACLGFYVGVFVQCSCCYCCLVFIITKQLFLYFSLAFILEINKTIKVIEHKQCLIFQKPINLIF